MEKASLKAKFTKSCENFSNLKILRKTQNIKQKTQGFSVLDRKKECNFNILIAGGRNVFLVETVENDDPLGIVCWCSLESAAVFNPNHKVFLITLHKSTVGLTF